MEVNEPPIINIDEPPVVDVDDGDDEEVADLEPVGLNPNPYPMGWTQETEKPSQEKQPNPPELVAIGF